MRSYTRVIVDIDLFVTYKLNTKCLKLFQLVICVFFFHRNIPDEPWWDWRFQVFSLQCNEGNEGMGRKAYIEGLVQDCSNFSALAMELLLSCTKLPIWYNCSYIFTGKSHIYYVIPEYLISRNILVWQFASAITTTSQPPMLYSYLLIEEVLHPSSLFQMPNYFTSVRRYTLIYFWL